MIVQQLNKNCFTKLHYIVTKSQLLATGPKKFIFLVPNIPHLTTEYLCYSNLLPIQFSSYLIRRNLFLLNFCNNIPDQVRSRIPRASLAITN